MESILEQPQMPLPASKQYNATSLHLLPCGIQHDGKANIPSYFFLVDGQYPSDTSAQEPTTTITTTNTTTSATSFNPKTVVAEVTESTSVTVSTTSSVPVLPETSFRGRTLKGTVVKVPQGYSGSIYTAVEEPETKVSSSSADNDMDMSLDTGDDDEAYEAMLKGMQEQRKVLKTEGQFSEFMLWGHDQAPTLKNDKLIKAMQWIDIANVLHASV
ncbi:hypothetical protein CPC16_004102 [Podila verticillata]|nr:hypothetical protein BGZ59_000737 [Podila verticillata]KAF9391623.1 hypothetical protein CPC16_004102 [Podila verticillata]KFH71984.1 hypothetical protein MVEG_02278 [Podila verticillata NRRL 6337]